MYAFGYNGVLCIVKTDKDLTSNTPGSYKHFHIPNVFVQNMNNSYIRFKNDPIYRDVLIKNMFNNKK